MKTVEKVLWDMEINDMIVSTIQPTDALCSNTRELKEQIEMIRDTLPAFEASQVDNALAYLALCDEKLRTLLKRRRK